MKNRFFTTITNIVRLYFKPWRSALLFALGATLALVASDVAESNQLFNPLEKEAPIITFHMVPDEKDQRTFTIANFNGSLVWAEQEFSGSSIQMFRKRLMPPIKSSQGIIRVETPFGIHGFFLEGNPVDGKNIVIKIDL